MTADSHNKPPPGDVPRVPELQRADAQPAESGAATTSPRKRSGAVILPGILLILVGLLNLLVALVFLAAGYGCLNANPNEFERELRRQNPEQVESLKKQQIDIASLQFYTTFVCFGLGLLTAVMGLAVLFGGTGMLRSRGYGGAVFGALVALISPGGFCLLGLLAGIYALIVLMLPNVRQSFR